jgi:molybdate transport system permease protein
MDTFAMTPLEIEALNLSLRVALWCVAISLPFGIACAWVLARMEFPGKTLFDSIIHLPLVLPPVVVGYALLVLSLQILASISPLPGRVRWWHPPSWLSR